MGVYENHEITVPLILNISTGTITPQFHVLFDDWFVTVPSENEDLQDLILMTERKCSESQDSNMFWMNLSKAMKFQKLNKDVSSSLKSIERSDNILAQQAQSDPDKVLDV